MKNQISRFTGFYMIAFIMVLSGQGVKGQISVDSVNYHSLYAGAGFTNNMVYMGTSISQDKPVYSASLTYGYKEKLYLSVSTFHLSAFDPFLAFHTLTLNYSHTINTWFDFSGDISRYQVAPSLTDTLFNNFLYGNLAFGFDWKILYTNISMSGILSGENSVYFQVRNSRYFQTPDILDGKANISFDPYINVLCGNLTKTKTSDGTTISVSQPFSSKRSDKSNSLTTTFFSVMEIDMGIPVSFNTGKLTLGAEPGYILPLYSGTELFNPKGFSITLNIILKIL